MCWKLNKVIAKEGVLNPNFMVDGAKQNWNTVQIVYGFNDPSKPIIFH